MLNLLNKTISKLEDVGRVDGIVAALKKNSDIDTLKKAQYLCEEFIVDLEAAVDFLEILIKKGDVAND